MTVLQWLFIIAAGVAGYLAVSFLIDRTRRGGNLPSAQESEAVTAITPAQPQLDERRIFNEEPVQPGSPSVSAWEEFKGKDK